MSLQFILGEAGSGKSHELLRTLLSEAEADRKRRFFLIVPEQFSLTTQKELVRLSGRDGILNIDVLSMARLAYRTFAATGTDKDKLIEENGKSLILHKVALEKKDELPYLGKRLVRPGQIEEMKSVLSELMQYGLTPEDLLKNESAYSPTLTMKLRDIAAVNTAFKEKMRGTYYTIEEVPEKLAKVIPMSDELRDCTIAFDGFTGFTPNQLPVIKALMLTARSVIVTSSLPHGEDLTGGHPEEYLFAMSRKMIRDLSSIAEEADIPVLEPVRIDGRNAKKRSGTLSFISGNLFRSTDKTENDGSAAISRYKDPESEVRAIARTIRRFLRKDALLCKDIAVLSCDLELYGDLIKRIFPDYGIPFFLDERQDVTADPFIEFVRAFMEIADTNYTPSSVIRLLRTGLADISRDDTDRLENYLIALNVRGKKSYESQFTFHYRGEDPAEVPHIDEIRKRLVSFLIPATDKFSASRSAKEKTTAIYEFLRELNIEEKLGDTLSAKVYAATIELFNKTAVLLDDSSLSMKDYRAILESALLGIRIGIVPPTGDNVQIGDLQRSRLSDIKVMFLCGANDENLPKAGEKGGLLTGGDRRVLSSAGFDLSPDLRSSIYEQRFYLYLALSRPSEKLFISYPTSEGQSPLRPSLIVGQIADMIGTKADAPDLDLPETPREGIRLIAASFDDDSYPDLPSVHDALKIAGESDVIEKFISIRTKKDAADDIGRAVAKALYGSIDSVSSSRLETFASCAFRHFSAYGLELKERPAFEYGAIDRGTLIHDALYKYGCAIKDSGRKFTDLSADERHDLISECVNKTAGVYGNLLLLRDARSRYEIERLIRLATRAVDVITEQLSRGDFEPWLFEAPFRCIPDKSALNKSVSGIIDRVDIAKDGDRALIKIIDYKTGALKFDLAKFYHGLQLQLIIYLEAAKEFTANETGLSPCPAGIFYQRIDDPVIEDKDGKTTDEDIEKEILKNLMGSGIVSSDPDIIPHLDSTLTPGEGESEVIPVAYKKDGEFKASSQVVDHEGFDLISEYGKYITGKLRDEIEAGITGPSPYQYGSKSPCDYCPYLDVCRFDRLHGEYRNLADYSRTDSLIKIDEALNGKVD